VPAVSDAPAGLSDKFLPDDSDGVVSINVRQILDSELIKKTGIEKAFATEDAKKAIKEIGIDPLKDVDRVVAAGSTGGKGDQGAVIVQGTFDQEKLRKHFETAAKEKKDHLKVHKTDDGTFYEVTNLDELVKLPPQAGQVDLKGKSVFVVLADKNTVVFTGSKDAAADTLLKARGKKDTRLKNRALLNLLGKLDPKASLSVALPAPTTEKKLKSIVGGITITGDVKTEATVTAADADTAKELNEAIGDQLKQAEGIVGFLVLQQKELAPLTGIITGIKHEVKDSTIVIKSDITGETLEKLAKAAVAMAKKGAAKKDGDKKDSDK